MSTNNALERQVTAIRALWPETNAPGTAGRHAKVRLDRHFRALTDLLATRIAYLIRRYGLADMHEDAEQACAIAVHRAIQEFDGDQSSFSTFVTWKLRGELQGLRHRMRLDQRPGATRIGAQTISLEASGDGAEGESWTIVDNEAETRTESGASAAMARRMAETLLRGYVDGCREGRIGNHLPPKPGTIAPEKLDEMEATLTREKQIVTSHLLGVRDRGDDGSLTNEQKRQVTRRVLRHVTKQMAAEPRYAAAWATLH